MNNRTLTLIYFYLFLGLFSNIFAGSIEAQNFLQKSQEVRYQTLIAEIRCPVCQGQSIGGSNAGLAQDLREQVKIMILNNNTNEQIRQFMVARYGDFVVFKPPVNQTTYLLWFAPFAFLLLGFWFFITQLKSKKTTLTTTNMQKAKTLLK